MRTVSRAARWVPLCAMAWAVAAAAGPAPDRQGPDAVLLAQAAATAPADAVRDGEPFEGRVAAYLLSPEAGVAGLLFTDGRELRVPPPVGRRLAALVRPGQAVQVGPAQGRAPHGWPSVTVVETGQRLAADEPAGSDDGPPAPPTERPAPLAPMHVSGIIERLLHGPRGETNGLLLTSGVQVAFPPRVALEAGSKWLPGKTVDVEGFGRSSEFGTAVQATSIGSPDEPPVKVYGR